MNAATLAQVVARRRMFGTTKRRHPRNLPKQIPPTLIQADYFKGIRTLLHTARALVAQFIIPRLPEFVRDSRTDVRTDASNAQSAIDAATRAFEAQLRARGDELERLAQRTATRTSAFQRAQLGEQVKAALGIELPLGELGAKKVTGFVEENAALIRTVPRRYLEAVGATVLREVKRGTRHEEIAEQLERDLGIAENRAALIARDQVSKLYSDINTERQKALGIERYEWSSSQDERVRDEHAELNGKIFSYSDPPSVGNPGEDINCRCVAIPVFEDRLGELGL